MMKKKFPDLDHEYNVWHAAKAVKKKLSDLAKLKGNEELGPWMQSISNHLWWCSATCLGDADVLKEMWTSHKTRPESF